MSDRTDIQRIFNPLLKVTFASYVEQEAGGPQEDDCHLSKGSNEDLLVKLPPPSSRFQSRCPWLSCTQIRRVVG